MPVNRSYGGYSSHGNSAYSNYGVPKYSSGYGSSYGFRSGSSSPAMVRASTPSYRESFSYNSIINTVVPEEKNGSHYRPYYSPYSRSFMSSADAERKELKTYKTEELDTSDNKKSERRDYAVPGEITRDTTINLPRGKAVVRMVTQKLKDNPYLSSLKGKEKETENLTLGQRLALKYQMKERPKPKAPTPPVARGSGTESDWTWETCSSSEDESPVKKASPPKRKSPSPFKPVANLVAAAKTITQKYTRSNTATLCTTDDKPKQIVIPARSPAALATPLSSKSSSMNRWLEAANSETKLRSQTSANRIPNYGKAVAMNRSLLGNKLQEPGKPESSISSARNNSTTSARPVSWAGNQYTSDLRKPVDEPETSQSKQTTHTKTSGGKSDSSRGSSSPDLYKYRKPQKYQGAGSRLLRLSSSDDEQVNDNLTLGWRRGQPPRGEVVVKMTSKKAKNKPVIEPKHSPVISPVTSSVGSPTAIPISSRVPAFMQDKYQIPGLMFKASTKREPVTNTPAHKVDYVKTAPVEEESEWEYYTESSEEEEVESTEKVNKTETTVPTSVSLNKSTKEAIIANQITQIDVHKLCKTTPSTDNVVKTPATAKASSAVPSSHSNVSTSLNNSSVTSNKSTKIDNVPIKHEISYSMGKIPKTPVEDCPTHVNKSAVNKNDHEDKSIAVFNKVKKDDVIQSENGSKHFETLDKSKTLKLDHVMKDGTNTMNNLQSKNITTQVSHEPAPNNNISKTHQQSSQPPVKTDVDNKSNKVTLPQNIEDKTSKHNSLLHDKMHDAEVKNVNKQEQVKDMSRLLNAQKPNLLRQVTPNVAKPSVEESKTKTTATIKVHPEKKQIAAHTKVKSSGQSKPPNDQTSRSPETVNVKDIFFDEVKVEPVKQNNSSSSTQTKLKCSEQDKTTSDSKRLITLIETVKIGEEKLSTVTGKEEAPNLEVTKCKDETALKEMEKSKPKETSVQASSIPINKEKEERVKASKQEMVTSIEKAKVAEKSIWSSAPKKTEPVTAYEKEKILHDDPATEFVETKNEEKKDERKDLVSLPVHGREPEPKALQTSKQSTAFTSVLSQVTSVAIPYTTLNTYTDPAFKVSGLFQIPSFLNVYEHKYRETSLFKRWIAVNSPCRICDLYVTVYPFWLQDAAHRTCLSV